MDPIAAMMKELEQGREGLLSAFPPGLRFPLGSPEGSGELPPFPLFSLSGGSDLTSGASSASGVSEMSAPPVTVQGRDLITVGGQDWYTQQLQNFGR